MLLGSRIGTTEQNGETAEARVDDIHEGDSCLPNTLPSQRSVIPVIPVHKLTFLVKCITVYTSETWFGYRASPTARVPMHDLAVWICLRLTVFTFNVLAFCSGFSCLFFVLLYYYYYAHVPPLYLARYSIRCTTTTTVIYHYIPRNFILFDYDILK